MGTHKRVEFINPTLLSKIAEAGLNTALSSSVIFTPAKDFIKSYTKLKPENEVLPVVACCAMEYYGPNINADGFASQVNAKIGVTEKDLLQNTYKSFEDGYVYFGHDYNHIPIGKIIAAFWNDQMKWVECVVEIFASVCPDFIMRKIKANEMIFFSMGCDIPYDICSICGAKFFKKKDGTKSYCEHITSSKLKLVDDKVAYLVNAAPNFDDLSVVFIPADAIASSYGRKVASKGGSVIDIAGVNTRDKIMFIKDEADRALSLKIKKLSKVEQSTFARAIGVTNTKEALKLKCKIIDLPKAIKLNNLSAEKVVANIVDIAENLAGLSATDISKFISGVQEISDCSSNRKMAAVAVANFCLIDDIAGIREELYRSILCQ